MAKVGFWLRGARGKMGGAVLMKSENGTIARENVTPKNPRTSKQMYQRAIFATVASAAKAMKQLINHSFYGIAEGNKSIQEFRKLNLAKLRNKVAEDLAENREIDENIALLAPKNYKFIVPNEYQISNGTLSSLKVSFVTKTVWFSAVRYSANVSIKQFLNDLFGINPGEQLTVAYITAEDNNPIYVVPGHDMTEEGMSCGETSFISRRLVFKELNEEWDASITPAQIAAGADTVYNYLTGQHIFDDTKSDLTLLKDMFSTMTFGQVTVEGVTYSQVSPDATKAFDQNYVAGAFIRSKYENGQWNYSTAIMRVIIPGDPNFGVMPKDAVASYTDGVSVGEDNNPFLDEGGNGGTLE